MPGRTRRRRRSPRMHPRFRKLCKTSHEFVNLLRRCTRQLKQRSNGCKPLSVLGDADAVEKENLERALSRARTQAVVPVSAQIISTKGFIEREKKRLATAEEAIIAAVKYRDECIKALAEGERRFEELQLQEKSFVAPVSDAEAELRASGRAPRISERSQEAHEAEDLSSGGHARADSSRVISLDGRPSGGRARSSSSRRPQSRHRVEFDADEGSRTDGRR